LLGCASLRLVSMRTSRTRLLGCASLRLVSMRTSNGAVRPAAGLVCSAALRSAKNLMRTSNGAVRRADSFPSTMLRASAECAGPRLTAVTKRPSLLHFIVNFHLGETTSVDSSSTGETGPNCNRRSRS
jgi:hypothetical protein